MRGISIPDSKTYDIGTVIKTTMRYLYRNRYTEKKKTENPDIDPHKYAQLIILFLQRYKSNSMERRESF